MMAETKMNKTRHCAGRLCGSIRLKCNFIFTIQKILFFFRLISNLRHQSFWGRFDPKRDYKMVNECLKVSRLRNLERKTVTATPAVY